MNNREKIKSNMSEADNIIFKINLFLNQAKNRIDKRVKVGLNSVCSSEMLIDSLNSTKTITKDLKESLEV